MIRPNNLPRDSNQRAHKIVQILTGEVEPETEPERSPVSAYLAEIGRKGGLKGGAARAALPAKKRSAMARKAARARWKKTK